jgi:DNA-binding NarL/FixJ family response regulator
MIRVWISIRHAERRAAMVRMLRTDASVLLVSGEDEADIVVRDAQTEAMNLPAPATDQLTPREQEVLQLVSSGLDNRTIGQQLGITRSTVKHHLEAVFAKLEVHGRTEAVREGLRRGLVPL